jgi:hypothetical protein
MKTAKRADEISKNPKYVILQKIAKPPVTKVTGGFAVFFAGSQR